MHIQYAAPKKPTTRKSAAAVSVSGEVAAATWASAPQPPQQQQQRSQKPLPTPQQPAAGAKGEGRQRGGRGKAKNESASSEHSTRSASSPLPMMDITGQVEAAVAAAKREHATPWRTQGNSATRRSLGLVLTAIIRTPVGQVPERTAVLQLLAVGAHVTRVSQPESRATRAYPCTDAACAHITARVASCATLRA